MPSLLVANLFAMYFNCCRPAHGSMSHGRTLAPQWFRFPGRLAARLWAHSTRCQAQCHLSNKPHMDTQGHTEERNWWARYSGRAARPADKSALRHGLCSQSLYAGWKAGVCHLVIASLPVF